MSDPSATSFRMRGAWAAALLVPSGLLALFSHPHTHPGTWERTSVVVLSWTCFLPGAVLRLWSTLYIGRRKSREVVCEGPYSICRNPLYVGSFLLWLSAGLLLESPPFLAAVLLSAVGYGLWVVPKEERFLGEAFGEEYRRYLQEVPRFLPRFSLLKEPEVIQVHTRGIRHEWKRAVFWLWMPVLGRILYQFRWQPWWPHLPTAWERLSGLWIHA